MSDDRLEKFQDMSYRELVNFVHDNGEYDSAGHILPSNKQREGVAYVMKMLRRWRFGHDH